MNRKFLLITTAFIVLFSIVNSSVFVYRWMISTVTVVEPSKAEGIACTGFYSVIDQRGIEEYLPPAGSNAYTITYGTNTINIIPGRTVCILNPGEAIEYVLYESIYVEIPITVGYWYIHDFYGFGYYSKIRGVSINITLVVEESVDPTILAEAKLVIYKAGTNEYIGELNLTNTGEYLSIILYPYEALRLDLVFNAINPGITGFRVGFQLTYSP
ncbi:MAG: hypothetical protein QXU89_01665 [Desulfurococcaceae archaeon]